MIQRRFIIGSEWIYLKIYSGPKSIEQIFIYDIIPIVNLFIKSGYIDSYFFVRYMDPNYHIRLRLHCPNICSYVYIFDLLKNKLDKHVKNLTITKVQIDTYAREIERYGRNRITYCETLFFYDSCLISKCLKKMECADTDRYKISMKYIDEIMTICGFNIDKKINFVDHNRMAYFQEIYQSDKSVKAILNSKYRSVKNEIENCLENNSNWWNKDISQCINKIMLLQHNFIKKNEDELTSVIHMHINRMFRTQQRVVELLIYWYLYKYYISLKNRNTFCV